MSHQPLPNSTNSPSNTIAPKSKYLREGFLLLYATPTRRHAAHYTITTTLPFLHGSIELQKSFKMSHQPLPNSEYSRRTTTTSG
eukprot:scaffold6_cov93-Skeletonema_marinoi.AAC.1